ncbi:hypothetical protein BCR32DRAFT_283484 [Anaeromyces robustus]|uniref:Uncharacterized protein n=1 Tax=Anaeromyces robustus TaxID=1754192 RepID=A0A1Y1WUA8_9FUNG|nr:hypothetical protein BCR32DRAFT_283484 [Anaeromyces robustus]|eukprot:ORX77127.1 hypothetical protein BCR32DRAFT_283484 [Anaeromyces robustus]
MVLENSERYNINFIKIASNFKITVKNTNTSSINENNDNNKIVYSSSFVRYKKHYYIRKIFKLLMNTPLLAAADNTGNIAKNSKINNSYLWVFNVDSEVDDYFQNILYPSAIIADNKYFNSNRNPNDIINDCYLYGSLTTNSIKPKTNKKKEVIKLSYPSYILNIHRIYDGYNNLRSKVSITMNNTPKNTKEIFSRVG